MLWWCNVQERCRLIFVLCLGETLTDAETIILLLLLPRPLALFRTTLKINLCLFMEFLGASGLFSSLLPTLETPKHKRESFLLELPAMVGRRRARNLRSNLLLIFPAQSCRVERWGRVQQGIWATRCQHSLRSSWGCVITPFGKDSGTQSQGQRKDCWALQRQYPFACRYSVRESVSSLCV